LQADLTHTPEQTVEDEDVASCILWVRVLLYLKEPQPKEVEAHSRLVEAYEFSAPYQLNQKHLAKRYKRQQGSAQAGTAFVAISQCGARMKANAFK
jgi:hypothetical protein